MFWWSKWKGLHLMFWWVEVTPGCRSRWSKWREPTKCFGGWKYLRDLCPGIYGILNWPLWILLFVPFSCAICVFNKFNFSFRILQSCILLWVIYPLLMFHAISSLHIGNVNLSFHFFAANSYLSVLLDLENFNETGYNN